MTTRVVQWKEMPVQVREVPLEGTRNEVKTPCDDSYALVYAGHGRTDNTGRFQALTKISTSNLRSDISTPNSSSAGRALASA
jgi:hypothetical protein